MRPPYEIGHELVGRYRITTILGSWELATVYEAHDSRMNRAVAVHVLHMDGYDQASYERRTLTRLKREVGILANMSNPHVVPLFEQGTTPEGFFFMVFERLLGEDMSVALRRSGRMHPDDVARVITQVSEALAEAHGAGLLHRDVRPETIRVRNWNPLSVAIMDFGLARALDDGCPAVTARGKLIRPPRYLAPEQLDGLALTPATDIYGLGIVAFELLVGGAAAQGNAWEENLNRFRHGYFYSYEELQQVNAALIRLIQAMIALRPQDRPQSAAQIVEIIDGLSTGKAPVFVPIAEPSVSVEAAPTAFPVRLAVVAVILVAVVLATGTGLIVYFTHKEPPPPEFARPRPVELTGLIKSSDPSGTAPDAAAEVDVGCAPRPPFTGQVSYVLGRDGRLDGVTVVPANYDRNRKYPVVVLLHQTLEPAATLLPHTKFPELAEQHGALVLAPQDSVAGAPWHKPSDVERIREMVDELAANFCIDRSRVYAVGQGQGGRLAMRLSCADWIAGVATNSFRASRDEVFCETPKPMIRLEPLLSDREPVGGGNGCGIRANPAPMQSLAQAEDDARKRNVCGQTREKVYEYRDSKCFEWDCETPTRFCHLHGGHPWPGAPRRDLALPMECDGDAPAFPTGAHIWEFFGLDEAPQQAE